MPGRAGFPVRRDACQAPNFAQRKRLGKKPPQPKKWVFPGMTGSVLCQPKMNIHNLPFLWKTPVDKHVENVENFELSTGIPPLLFSTISCGKPAYVFAYRRPVVANARVTSPRWRSVFSSKNLKKVYNP
ncbi:MAG: hypothetical protein MR762_03855 [Clostridiales bacterium]|nr:hypothetical protein [Clostridiales bacterium]